MTFSKVFTSRNLSLNIAQRERLRFLKLVTGLPSDFPEEKQHSPSTESEVFPAAAMYGDEEFLLMAPTKTQHLMEEEWDAICAYAEKVGMDPPEEGDGELWKLTWKSSRERPLHSDLNLWRPEGLR